MEKKYIRFYQKLTIAGSIICFIFFGLSAYEENSLREWKNYQKEFKEILISKAESELEQQNAENFQVEIKQNILDGFDRVDRCISCHNGIENPNMTDQSQLHATHSGNYIQNHPVEEFGCSICHGGQDRALSATEVFAQSEGIHWEYPVIPVQYGQSACGRCHLSVFETDQKLEGAEVLLKGQNIFLREGCLSCHNVRGTGGITSVELTNQGKKTSIEYSFENVHGERSVVNWLEEHFIDPQTVAPGSVMPKHTFSDEEMTALITYTMSLFTPEYSTDYYSLEVLAEIKGDRKSLPSKESYRILCANLPWRKR